MLLCFAGKCTQQRRNMLPRDYLNKYRLTIKEFSGRVGITPACMWHYLSGRRKPSQRTAEKMEKESDGIITVMEMRGKDARTK
jgi:hypothetical protein